MGNHRAQAQFDRAKWQLWVLAPFWAVQLTMAMGILGLSARSLGGTTTHYKERDNAGKTPTIEFAWEATNIILSVIVIICTVVSIAKYFAESLTPWTMLFTHIISLVCAFAILVLDMAVRTHSSDGHYSLVGLGLDAFLMITAFALTVYAGTAWRHVSAYDDYAHPVNVKPYGFSDGLERGNSYSYSSRLGLRSTVDKRESIGSSRLSIGSIANGSVSLQLQPLEERQTSRRYSHERDTQFEEYLTRRGSVNHHADVERGTGHLSPFGGSLRESMLVAGSPGSRSRGSSVSRAISYGSEHILGAVPEEEGDAADAAGHRMMGHEVTLGHEQGGSEDDANEPRVPQEAEMADPKRQRE